MNIENKSIYIIKNKKCWNSLFIML
jgi:hypothetical protein